MKSPGTVERRWPASGTGLPPDASVRSAPVAAGWSSGRTSIDSWPLARRTPESRRRARSRGADVPIANSADPGVAIPRAAPDSVESILESTGIADLRPGCTAEEQERALRALGEQAMDLDPVRVALLRDRAIQALKAGGI